MDKKKFDLSFWDLSGKSVVVTGAGRGIGKWVALGLACAGADVCVADINGKMASEVSHEINELGKKSMHVEIDISEPDAVSAMMNTANEYFGGLDVVINNAGVNVHKSAINVTHQDFNFVQNVNSKGVFFCSQAAAKIMIPARKGKIINTASTTAFLMRSGVPNSIYAMTKAGIVMLTKACAEEWARYNINVNGVAPGYMDTSLVAEKLQAPAVYKSIIESTPLRRIGQAEDLIGAFIFLASDASDFITGQTICVDGGRTIL